LITNEYIKAIKPLKIKEMAKLSTFQHLSTKEKKEAKKRKFLVLTL